MNNDHDLRARLREAPPISIRQVTRQDAPDTDRFNCAICYEYMEAPSSCGECSGRFCKTCLINEKQSQRGLCPMCRRPIDRIEEDLVLLKEMEEMDNIPCRFEGCDASLSLRQVKHHEEEVCRMVRVVCRHREFGCAWQGRRCDLQNHEDEGCALTNHVREMARRQAARSPSNPFCIALFVIQVTCCSPSLIQAKAVWWNMYATSKARAAVFNFLTLVPTCLLVARLVWVEYAKYDSIVQHPQFSFDSMDKETEEILNHSTNTIGAFIMALNQIIFALCYGNKSGEEREFPERHVQTGNNLLSTGFFLTYITIFSAVDGIYSQSSLAIVLFTASTMLPTAVAAFSCGLANSPHVLFRTGRVAEPVIAGILLAFAAHGTDALSYFKGMLTLLASCTSSKKLHVDLSPFLEHYSAVGGIARELYSGEADFSAAVKWGVPCAWLALVIAMASWLTSVFEWVGSYLHQVAQASRSNNRSTNRKANVIGLGLLSVTVCSYIFLATI